VGVAIPARGLAELRTEVDTEGGGNTNGSATHARADDDDDDSDNSRSSNKHFHGSGAVRANQGTAVADGWFWLMASMMEDHRHGREHRLEVSQKTSVAKGARRSCALEGAVASSRRSSSRASEKPGSRHPVAPGDRYGEVQCEGTSWT